MSSYLLWIIPFLLSCGVGQVGGELSSPDSGSIAADAAVDAGGQQVLLGYPVGDKSTYPAGGWAVWQVLGHYWSAWGGRHLAQDLAHSSGGVATVNQPVFSVGDGLVRYAGPNTSTYTHVVLIEHQLADRVICSFYAHITEPLVATGDTVTRGQEIAAVLDWALIRPAEQSSNTHLHYTLLSKELCDLSASASGTSVCGYDKGGPNEIHTIDDEPESYTAINDICGDSGYPDGFLSPTRTIESYHFAR